MLKFSNLNMQSKNKSQNLKKKKKKEYFITNIFKPQRKHCYSL